MTSLFELFMIFLKVNLLTGSGPASVGYLYKEVVGTIMTEAQFVEAVGLSSVLPGSEALQLAMFVGYAAHGFVGAVVALFASILPPTLIMLAVGIILQKLRNDAWVGNFVRGLTPAVAVLMVMAAFQIFRGSEGASTSLLSILIAAGSFVAFYYNAPIPYVLIGAGLLGIIFFR